MPKITPIIFIIPIFITLLFFPEKAYATACIDRGWQIDIRTNGQKENTVAIDRPYKATIQIPNIDFRADYRRLKARIPDREDNNPLRPDDFPVGNNAFAEVIVDAPSRASGDFTKIEFEFSDPNFFFKREETGKFFEIDFETSVIPGVPTWRRICDNGKNRFQVVNEEPPKCNLTEVNACQVNGQPFAPKVETLTGGYDYYYFLSNTPPPSIGERFGIKQIVPAINVNYQPAFWNSLSIFASNRLNSSNETLSNLQGIVESLPVDSTRKYYLFIAGGKGNPLNPLDQEIPIAGIPARVCAVAEITRTASDQGDLCRKPNIRSTSNQTASNVCAGNQCSKSAGTPCTLTDSAGKSVAGIDTALGCVPTSPQTLIESLIRFSLGIGGGIALLLMIFGAFQIITSAGNAETLKKGQDQFSSALIGLLFIAFSVLLLQLIGVDILNIPGFS